MEQYRKEITLGVVAALAIGLAVAGVRDAVGLSMLIFVAVLVFG